MFVAAVFPNLSFIQAAVGQLSLSPVITLHGFSNFTLKQHLHG